MTQRNAILAFAECLELAKSGRQQAPSITTGLQPKPDVKAPIADMTAPMSAFRPITSALPPKPAVNRRGRLRRELTHNGHGLG